ncbi:MAG: transglycosylase SLT domain-containing protein [Rhizobiales bacterium]|nr:transglycosylase SLT domain-containing protein [Hyphomicrobiales bacterium]
MVGFISETPGINISGALQNASQRTGVGFEYLMRTAMQESSLRPDAQASTSSAAGLFQFIESTWLRTLKTEGPNLGLGEAAQAIEATGQGRYTVRDSQLREQILNMRHDPEVAALMAGALTRENSDSLNNMLGRSPTDGELYMAHFLGADGAGRLISLAEERPGISAARAFPDAARANRSIFYERDGRARNTADVYHLLNRKHEAADAPAREILGEMPPAPRVAGIGSLFESLFRVFTGRGAEQPFSSYFTTENLDRLAEEPVAPTSRNGLSISSSGERQIYGPPTLAAATASASYSRHAVWSDIERRGDDPAAIA